MKEHSIRLNIEWIKDSTQNCYFDWNTGNKLIVTVVKCVADLFWVSNALMIDSIIWFQENKEPKEQTKF